MTITYQIDQDDYLQQMLFNVSKSEIIRKRRNRQRYGMSLISAAVGIWFLLKGYEVLAYMLIIIGIVTVVFYPLYERSQYVEYYKKLVQEVYHNRIGDMLTIRLMENAIETIDSGGEMKVYYSEFIDVTEVGLYFFIRLKSTASVSISKLKSGDVSLLKKELKAVCERNSCPFLEELDWKWK